VSERTVFLAGYSGREPDWLLSAALRLDAVVFDVRYSPRSRRPQWSGTNLAVLLGERYVHVRGFGNEAYRTADIRLHDPERGLALFDQETRPVVLLCVCANSATCHRMTAASFIAERRNVRISDVDDAVSEVSGRQMALFTEGAS
jgi:uncharacterized protein (DUF488 family)